MAMKCKKLYMASFFFSGVSIIFAGLFGSIYLLAYPYHSNPCDGLTDPNAKPSAVTCPAQVEARGYKSTTSLVTEGLLPASFPTNDGNGYSFCKWNTNTEKCEETPGLSGAGEKCDSLTDDNGSRKYRHGNDGECESSRIPEICKQTGIENSADQAVIDHLVNVGMAVDIAAALFLVVAALGSLSFLNILSHREYGKLPFLDCSLLCLCSYCVSKGYGKTNKTGGRFSKKYESCGIFYTLLLHDLLILIAGTVAVIAYVTVELVCYGAKDQDVYGDLTAKEFLNGQDDTDAKKLLLASDGVFITFGVFLGLTAASAIIKMVGFSRANADSDDMDITLPENMECCPGGSKGSFGSGLM